MKQVDFKFFRRLLHDARGAEIAEAAAVLPIMFMVLLGIFWFGQAFSIYGAITRAAQEGVRASVPLCTTCGTPMTYNAYATAAQTAVSNALIASHLDPTQMQMTAQPTFSFCLSPLTLCPATGAACVQLPVQLVTSAQGTTDCGISVALQYPFKFWLPFTSISNQQILLTASATARMETN
ncbi:MAG TPA: TadE/TadG family type IV pilus assembly protein [Candidatus Eisenbacteria bacterium]|nr:TadE/TadG family type IV pilus assembly protein [Candidatus Eisenbacteria bacterium]